MKSLLYVLILFPSIASARIGETPEECSKRYGDPVKIDKAEQTIVYKKAGLGIMVWFWEGHAHQIFYMKLTDEGVMGREELSNAEREKLLESNKGDSEWKKGEQLFEVNPFWKSKDGKRHARYDSFQKAFVILTEAFALHQKAQKDAADKANLEGL